MNRAEGPAGGTVLDTGQDTGTLWTGWTGTVLGGCWDVEQLPVAKLQAAPVLNCPPCAAQSAAQAVSKSAGMETKPLRKT